MKLALTRQPAAHGATLGALAIDGRHFAWTLEPASPVAVGSYRCLLTVSGRATHGGLWSPDPQNRLPLIADVPGRSGIRIHAGNRPWDTAGCVLVGFGQEADPPGIFHSRQALVALIGQMEQAGGEAEIEIVGPVVLTS